jgi:hypothetical protein
MGNKNHQIPVSGLFQNITSAVSIQLQNISETGTGRILSGNSFRMMFHNKVSRSGYTLTVSVWSAKLYFIFVDYSIWLNLDA